MSRSRMWVLVPGLLAVAGCMSLADLPIIGRLTGRDVMTVDESGHAGDEMEIVDEGPIITSPNGYGELPPATELPPPTRLAPTPPHHQPQPYARPEPYKPMKSTISRGG